MERILCILVVATVFFRGDAILLRNPLAHRYGGGGLKRPSFSGSVGGYVSSYGSPSGSSPGPLVATGGSLAYSSSNVVASNAYGGGSYGSSYNAPSGSINGQVYSSPSSSGYGQSSFNSPSISYNRPFGLPEGQKFPHGGFTYKFPNERPPRPPVKSSYISKPYPDFIVRFKSPLYPPQVSVYDKQEMRPPAQSYPVSGVAAPPVYQPGATPVAEIPMYVSDKDQQQQPPMENVQGVNVGASYQTGSGLLGQPVPALSGPPPPFISQDVVLPPSTSIYLLSSDAVAADKFESLLPSNGSGVQNAFIELSKDSVFGSTAEPGVVKPLTPDVVYSPEKNEQFKPMYIFGPMYFPKSDTDLKADVASESASVIGKSPTETKSECVETDAANPKCSLKSVEAGTVAPSTELAAEDSAPAATGDESEASANEGGKSKNAASSDSRGKSSTQNDEDNDDDGGRGLLHVVKQILGVDDSALDDEEEHVSRVDGKKSSSQGSSRPLVDEEEDEEEENDEDLEGTAPPKRRRRPTASSSSSSRNKNRLRNGSSKTSSPSRFSSSGKKSSSSGGSRGSGAPSPGTVSLGVDQRPEPLDEVEDKKPDDRNSAASGGDGPESQQPTGFVPDQSIEGAPGGQGVQADGAAYNADPVVGSVQIGYIGGPPPGAPYSPYQPFFYPAGIPAFDNNHNPVGPGLDPAMHPSRDRFEADHTQKADEDVSPPTSDREDVDGSVRRNFHGIDATDNSVHYSGQDEDRRPQFDDGSVSSSGYYNRPGNGFRNPSSYVNEGDRSFEPDTASQNHPDGHHVDYDSSDKPNAMDGNSVDDPKMEEYTSSQDPGSSSHTSTGYESDDDDASTPGSSYSTYPHTSSYGSSDAEDTPVTAVYASNADARYESSHSSYDPPTSSQTSSYLHVEEHVSEDPYAMSSESSALNEAIEPLSKNEVAEDVSSTTEYDYRSSAHANEASTAMSYQSSEDHGETSSDGLALESSTTSENNHVYASVTRRPFPSFYKYRTSYRPKDRNYVAPTTYRPALRVSSAASEKDVVVDVKDSLMDEKDASATIPNSVHDDFESSSDIVTASPVIESVTSYNFETANSEPLEHVHESPIVPYGSRIKSNPHSEE